MSDAGKILSALAFGLGGKKRPTPLPPIDRDGLLTTGSKGKGAKAPPKFGAGGCSCSKRKVQ